MAEGSVDRLFETEDSTGWSQQVDDRLTWVWAGRRISTDHVSGWPGIDQKLTDFHARYERACLED